MGGGVSPGREDMGVSLSEADGVGVRGGGRPLAGEALTSRPSGGVPEVLDTGVMAGRSRSRCLPSFFPSHKLRIPLQPPTPNSSLPSQ